MNQQKNGFIYYNFKNSGETGIIGNGFLIISGEGVDLGGGVIFPDHIKSPAYLEFDVKGTINKKEEWTRFRVEGYDEKESGNMLFFFEQDEMQLNISSTNFNRVNIPLKKDEQSIKRVQFMVIGPGEVDLVISNIKLY